MRKLATLIVESKEVRTPRDMEGYMIANNITYKNLPMNFELKEKSEEEKVALKAKIMAFHEEIREANRRGKAAPEGDDIKLKREEEIYKVLQKHMTQKGSENNSLQSSIEEVAATTTMTATATEPVVHKEVEVAKEVTETPVATAVEAVTEEVVETVAETAVETVVEEVTETPVATVVETVTEEAEGTIAEAPVETVAETAVETDTEEFVEAVVGSEADYIAQEKQEAIPNEGQQLSIVEVDEGVDIMETLAACFINELEGNVNDESMSVFDRIREENNVIYRKGKSQDDIELFIERTAKRKRSLKEKVEILATHFGRTLNQKKK